MARPSIALFLATAGLIAGVAGCANTAPAPGPKGEDKPAPTTSAPAHSQPDTDKGGEGGEGGEG
ncbi:MAG: hypothetical protein WCQ20_08930 [Synechococcaceae cyanobacterium ELA739]|jgi:hypothetical protein